MLGVHKIEDLWKAPARQTVAPQAGVVKHAGCDTFRHSSATHLLEDGYDCIVRNCLELFLQETLREAFE